MFTIGNEEMSMQKRNAFLAYHRKPLRVPRDSHVMQIDKYDIFTETFDINIILVGDSSFLTL